MDKEQILKKVKKFLDIGYRQILIRDDNVYASGGLKDITNEDIKNAAIVSFYDDEKEA